MVAIIAIVVAAGILSWSSAVSIAFNQTTTQSSTSFASSSAVDGDTTSYSLTESTLDPTWSVDLQHPAWIIWVDVNVPAKYGTRKIAMTTTNEGTVMPCNALNTWITSTTLRITCKNVVNATTITLVGTGTTESRVALSEVNVYGECPPGKFGQDCRKHCSENCVGRLCDHVDGMCTCTLGWKGDNCDRRKYNRKSKAQQDADALRSSVNPLVPGLVGLGITVAVVVVVAAAVLLSRRHRRRRQRTQEQVIYYDIIDDIHPGVPGSQVNQSESREDYDVLDITSRDPDDGLGKPYTDLNAIPQQRGSMSRKDYDVLDVTSRDPEEGVERTYTELTTNTTYVNIPISGGEKSC
ncbi:uncharacterized protein [Haliotis asinina]|uniref:uncharacterized protein n=1 Tax=Haliotis asinina TaxID=109174 RepID=UPI0035325AFD